MKAFQVLAVLALVLLQTLVPAARIDRFPGGGTSATADLVAPGLNDTVNITVPARCHVLRAGVNVTGQASASDPGAFPENVMLTLGDSELWRFKGFGYGPLGRQDRFLDEERTAAVSLGPAGGSGNATVRLPHNATVTGATAVLDSRGPLLTRETARLSGPGSTGAQFGYSAASAGDLDGDGLCDFIVGAPYDDSGGSDSGSAFIFLGDPQMDGTPDIVLKGESPGDLFGAAVSGAGDVNSDGYDDVVVGAPYRNAVNTSSGRTYVYFGGAAMDSVADVVLDGYLAYELLGTSVAGVGDADGDGYDDVVVGAPGILGSAVDRGSAYLYHGGQAMNGVPDLCMTGAAKSDLFGYSVAGAGDVDGDGDGDFLVGAPLNNHTNVNSGAAYLFLGSPSMDAFSEINFYDKYEKQYLGWSVAGAGDVNRDGYDDILVGAPGLNGALPGAGAAYIYLGGLAIRDEADIEFIGTVQDGRFGLSVSGGGDLDRDGCSDILVGAPADATAGAGAGAAFAFLGGLAMDAQPDLTLPGTPGDAYGSAVAVGGDLEGGGFATILAAACRADAGNTDAGQAYIFTRAPYMLSPWLNLDQLPLWSSDGYIAGPRNVPDFSVALNSYLSSNPASGVDGAGNSRIDIPFGLGASGEGNLTLRDLIITYDFGAAIPDFSDVLNGFIAGHQGAADAGGNLTIPLRLDGATPGRVRLEGLELELDEPPRLAEEVPLLAINEDSANEALLDLGRFFQDDYDNSSALNLSVYSVFPPGIVAVTTTPGRYLSVDALTGGENDNWTGRLTVRLRCTDRWGQEALSNEFDLVVRQVNDAPVFTGPPPAQVTGGMLYEQRLGALDAENDTLTFSREEAPAGMTVEAETGILRWTPSSPGAFKVAVEVSDGELSSHMNFTLVVTFINKAPLFTSTPVDAATGGLHYVYEPHAVDVDGDALNFTLAQAPAGMLVDHFSGRLDWTPGRDVWGNFSVVLVASDGKGGEVRQEFTVTVSPFAASSVSIIQPRANQAVSGKYLFSGKVARGTLNITAVQLRIDSKEWLNATGNESWGLLFDTRKLSDGTHLLEVRSYDGTAYSATVGVRFIADNQKGSDDTWIFVVAALVIIAVVGAVLFVWWRGQKPKVYDWG